MGAVFADEEGTGVLETLDAPAARRWCRASLEALGRAREEIDALNVFPVPDGDTGTNLYLTMEAAHAALAGRDGDADEASAAPPAEAETLERCLRVMAHGALTGARGNSGVILSQLLRGMAEALAGEAPCRGERLRDALRHAADAGYAAVAAPVEGTVLSVARAAADGAQAVASDELGVVAAAAADAARAALARTPTQLAALRQAGVVDAGGRGLSVVLDSLAAVVTGRSTTRAGPRPALAAGVATACALAARAYEVIYLLDAPAERIGPLRERLGQLGDSLVVVGGETLWNVHVHVDDVGTAIEAGIEAGRPHRIRVTHFGDAAARRAQARGEADRDRRPPAGPARAVVAVAYGEGLAELFAAAGAAVVAATPGRAPSTAELVAAIRATGAREVVLLPNDPDGQTVAEVAAQQVAADGIRAAVAPTKASAQGIAALAVHQAGRRFDQDVVAMTAAAGATRHGGVAVAAEQAWTMAGVCQAGDVLGLIDGDVAVIGPELAKTAIMVVDRMLAAGGELVTLVIGAEAPADLADVVTAHLSAARAEVDVVVVVGGQQTYPLLIGVE